MTTEHPLELLHRWHSRIRATQTAHYEEASALGRRHLKLGVPVVVLTTLVSTSVFAFLSTGATNPLLQIGTGVLSVVAAILASLQTFLNDGSKQTTHLLAATRLSGLKKRIEEHLAIGGYDAQDLKHFVREVLTEWNAITISAPLLSQSTFERDFNKALPNDVFEPVRPIEKPADNTEAISRESLP